VPDLSILQARGFPISGRPMAGDKSVENEPSEFQCRLTRLRVMSELQFHRRALIRAEGKKRDCRGALIEAGYGVHSGICGSIREAR
jgi:hypothetical protein